MIRPFVVPKSERSAALRYGIAAVAVLAATLVRFPLQPILAHSVPFLLYFPAVLIAAWYGGFGPGLLVTVAGSLASSFFWMAPYFAFAPLTTGNSVQLGLFVLVAAVMSWLVDLLHRTVISLKSAERDIRRHAERFRVTLSSIVDGVVATDRDACVQFMNPTAETLTGWKLSEAQGKSLTEVFNIVLQGTREKIVNRVQTVLKSNRIVELSNHALLISRDGTERLIEDSAAPIREDGQVLGVVLVFHDVTERDQNRRRMTEILSSMNDGFYIVDRDWRYLFVNESGARLAQKSRTELLGKTVWDLFPDEIGQTAYKEFNRVMNERVTAHFEYYYPRHGRWYEFKAYPAHEGLALYTADITDKKNVEQAVHSKLEQRVAEKTAELESKNQSLEALTYSLAHDLRAPMRAINSFGSILLEDHGKSIETEGQQLVHRMINSARHAEKLMADLLDYGKLAHVPLPISEIDTEAALDSVLRRAAQDIVDTGAKVNLTRPLPKVRANETVLSQAFGNLIGNALKYTRDGEPPVVRIFAQDKGGRARLVIEDNGPGIDPEHIPKLFKPFTRLDTSKPGSGLGLSIVAKGIERMGGTVGVDSKRDCGSRFWIELPKA
ncbi:MAG TPA: PAS domain-containing protein [Verrucomicrobiae bacterium]|nr:PAS domain-containing protein [Verrucomicrobiae bacterium]